MMMKKRDDQRIMCVSCFNEVFDPKVKLCPHCGAKGYLLAPIDENIFDDIQMLNRKGYRTVMCCEGHPENQTFKNHVSTGTSIQFQKKYDFDWGGKWSKVCNNWWTLNWGKRIETPTKKLRNGDEWYKELCEFKADTLKRLHKGVVALPCIK
jgi:hypothetical protein